jgi:NADPH-dependent 2,4-dienoyl-CoA reductase/sulfur reductase-like enzyme
MVAPMNRRQVMLSFASGGMLTALGCSGWPMGRSRPRVVVVGGGCAGATAAKYLRLWSDRTIDVTLIEPSPAYVSSPLSNRVIDGELRLVDLTRSYEPLASRHGVRIITDRVVSFDPSAKRLRLGRGQNLPYDKLVLAPGIDPQFEANQDVVAMGSLFKKAWKDLYGDLLEYRNHHQAVGVDAGTLTVRFDVQEDVRADVLNVLPPVRAGLLVRQAGLANINSRWCEVGFASFESKLAKDVYIIGDAIQAAPRMPKSGHLANGHAKVAAAAIICALRQRPLDPHPMLTNTCYSLVSPGTGMHSAAVYGYVTARQSFESVAGAGGVSAEPNTAEVTEGRAWAENLWADMLG